MGKTVPHSTPASYGRDDFGPFKIKEGECPKCQHEGLVVQYTAAPRLSDYVKKARALILNGKRIIGLTCGCYAKYHRQVAHIESGRRKR
jgi:hypothetical protein